MLTAIQSVSSGYAVNTPPALGEVFNSAQQAKSLLPVPNVIVTLGTTPPEPLTYNAAGLFESLLQVADTSQGVSGSITAPIGIANTAGTATNAATTITSATILASPLGLETAASNSGILNAPVILQGKLAIAAQALTALLAPNVNPSPVGGVDTLMVNHASADQLAIDLNASATGLDTTSVASFLSATGMLQGLPPDSRVQALDSLLSADLGLAAAAPLSSTDIAAALTTIGGSSAKTTTAAMIATPAIANRLSAMTSLPLPNVNLATISTGIVTSGITGTTASTGAVSRAIPSLAAAPAVPTATGTIPATPITAATVAAGNATTTAAVGNTSDTTVAASALARNSLMDSGTQALTNITENPAYANSVAALYVNTAILGSKQALATSLPNTTESVRPVPAVSHVNAVPQYTG